MTPTETTETDTEAGEVRETARLTADVVALVDVDGQWQVLLIRRGWPPYAGMWALPGGHLNPREHPDAAAARELAEETGLDAIDLALLDLVGVYGDPDRDPRGRYVSWAYRLVLDTPADVVGGDDATEALWVPVTQALEDGLAFDHEQIIGDAIDALTRANETATLAVAATTEALNAIGLLQAAAAGYRGRSQVAANAALAPADLAEARRLDTLAAELDRQARALEDTLLADLTAPTGC